MKPFRITVALLAVFLCVTGVANGRVLHKRHLKYTVTIPDKMILVADTDEHQPGEMYYDSTAGVVLMITEEESKFRSVKKYIDCSKQELETMLRNSYEDTTLHLLSCNQSPYYPKKVNIIIFDVSVLPYGFNRCVVYFVHHRHRDLQFSYMYNKDNAQACMAFIDGIMKTMKLK